MGGGKGRNIYSTWTLSVEGKKKLEPHYNRFSNHVIPMLNPVFASYQLNNEIQGSQTVDQYIRKLKLWPKTVVTMTRIIWYGTELFLGQPLLISEKS